MTKKSFLRKVVAVAICLAGSATMCFAQEGANAQDDTKKTVSVGKQVGVATARTKSEVTFPVTATNFPDGEYCYKIGNKPSEVETPGGWDECGKITITDGKGTLTIRTLSIGDVQGLTAKLTLIIDSENDPYSPDDDVISPEFTLTISPRK